MKMVQCRCEASAVHVHVRCSMQVRQLQIICKKDQNEVLLLMQTENPQASRLATNRAVHIIYRAVIPAL